MPLVCRGTTDTLLSTEKTAWQSSFFRKNLIPRRNAYEAIKATGSSAVPLIDDSLELAAGRWLLLDDRFRTQASEQVINECDTTAHGRNQQDQHP